MPPRCTEWKEEDAASVSSSEESEDSDTPPSPVVDVVDALQFLGTSTNEAQAIKSMEYLWQIIKQDSNAKKFMDAQGLSVIVFSLLRYKGSTMLVGDGFFFLSNLAYIVDTEQVCETLAALNFIDKISIFATSATNSPASEYAAALLCNLAYDASNLETKVKLASIANIKFMMNLMTSDPNNFCGILCACAYFENLIHVAEAKEQILEHGVILPLAAVYHRFRTWNGGTEEENSDVASILHSCKTVLSQLVVA